MIIKNVTFYIKSEHIEKFIEATMENRDNSRKEKGVEYFDFLQCKDGPNKFLLYEGYKSEEAMEEHLETEHFKKWINTVEKYFLRPRDKVTYIPVSPMK